MKILLVHSHYVFPGGEEAVLNQEKNLLSSDIEIKLLSFKNKSGFKGAIQFFCSLWNFRSSLRLKHEIITFKPDLIHIHNWHSASGPAIIRTAKKAKIPVVFTLHNYRILCPSGTFLVKGKVFTDSITSNFPWNAVINKAYRESFFQSLWLAFVVWIHKLIGTWKLVDRYITLTDFAKNIFLKSKLGLSSTQIVVKPNFVTDLGFTIDNRGTHFLYVGRLSPEKGIDVLLKAFIKSGFPIKIVGDGSLKDEVVSISEKYSNIEFLGSMPNERIRNCMREASALIFPSIWFEGMPMTIVEAFSTGTPVIASNLGAMQSMIQQNFNGMLFETKNVDDLIRCLHEWNSTSLNLKREFSLNSRYVYEKLYTPEANKNMLLGIYNDVLSKSFQNV